MNETCSLVSLTNRAGVPSPSSVSFEEHLESNARARNGRRRGTGVCVMAGLLLGVLSGGVSFGQPATPTPVSPASRSHLPLNEAQPRAGEQKALPPDSQPDLSLILRKAGERVTALFQNLPGTTSTEEVRWDLRVETPDSLGTSKSRHYYRYRLLVHPGTDGPLLEEYRTPLGETPGGGLMEAPNPLPINYDRTEFAPLVPTRIVATMLNFLPQKQASCRFRYLGRHMLDERESVKVGFTQIPDANPEVSALQVAGKSVKMPMKGTAWFDAASYEVLRIQSEPLAPRHDLALDKLTVTIDFQAISLGPVELLPRGETPSRFQLPLRAVVNARLSGRKFRAIHDYTDYKVFRVDSRVVPASQGGLVLDPSANPVPATVAPPPAPSAVNGPPLPSIDPWYPRLMIIYHKSKAPGLIAESDRASLDFPRRKFNAILAGAGRLEGKVQEIDAQMKAITDEARAAHPLPPELQAMRQERKELLTMEVAQLKSALGPEPSARLDVYVQHHSMKVHNQSSGHTPGYEINLSLISAYSTFFSAVTVTDRAATDRKDLEDQDGTPVRNRIRNDLGFRKEQFAQVRAAAQHWAVEEREYYAMEYPALRAYYATFETSPELKGLAQERVSTINNELTALRRTLGPTLTARLDAYLRVHY